MKMYMLHSFSMILKLFKKKLPKNLHCITPCITFTKQITITTKTSIMKKIFTPSVKTAITITFIIGAIAAGIVYTWHMYATGQFGNY